VNAVHFTPYVNDVNIAGMDTGRKAPYHHGDLRNALIDEAMVLARTGGPDAIAVRAAARGVGVSPSAAYRHFPSLEGLLAAVASRAREALARTMIERMSRVATDRDRPGSALARFRATGAAYIEFALSEPGLFRVAFAPCDPKLVVPDDPSPYAILSDAIDAVAATGVLPPARRHHAEEVAWSAVHGAAVLIGEGLMQITDQADRNDVVERVLDGVVHGLVGQEDRRRVARTRSRRPREAH
jgi:AcrR family transcriptional regulator